MQFQSAEEWKFPFQSCEVGDRRGRVAIQIPVVRDIRDQILEHWNEHIEARSSISEDSIISDLVLTLEADTHSI